jgi:hypothetical protein
MAKIVMQLGIFTSEIRNIAENKEMNFKLEVNDNLSD